MNTPFARFFAALSDVSSGPPADLAAFLESLPPAGDLPSPWEVWTLISLAHHRRRQLWVADIVRTRLGGTLPDLARLGALGHPEGRAQSGPVPGLPEWEYYFHGKGCCLTHKVRGDCIDVDFYEDSGEYIGSFFYTKYLEYLRHPEPAEARLRELHPSFDPVELAIDDLLSAGVLAPLPGREKSPYRIADGVLPHEEAMDAFCTAWADPGQRLWLAALIGDWLAAHKAALSLGRPDLLAFTQDRAEQCRQIRRQRLLRFIADQKHQSYALTALTDLGAPELDAVLKQSLRGPFSGLTSAALNIIVQLDDPVWCPEVHALFLRADPTAQYPEPWIWMRSLEILLRHDYHRSEILAALPRASRAEAGEACLLALEHAPQHALPLIRQALRSEVPIARTEIAAILALIDQPWTRRELLACLAASTDQERTADARAALLESRDLECHRAVQAWEERSPHEPEAGDYLQIEGRTVGPFYSLAEHALQGRAQRLRYEMEKLHDRVMKIRDTIPPEPSPWWRFWSR